MDPFHISSSVVPSTRQLQDLKEGSHQIHGGGEIPPRGEVHLPEGVHPGEVHGAGGGARDGVRKVCLDFNFFLGAGIKLVLV